MTDATISINGGSEIPLDKLRGSNGPAGDMIRSFIDRYERLEEEKQAIAGDQKEVLAEAKGNGLDTKILRKIIARRKRTRDEIQEEEALLEIYEASLQGSLPL